MSGYTGEFAVQLRITTPDGEQTSVGMHLSEELVKDTEFRHMMTNHTIEHMKSVLYDKLDWTPAR